MDLKSVIITGRKTFNEAKNSSILNDLCGAEARGDDGGERESPASVGSSGQPSFFQHLLPGEPFISIDVFFSQG